MATMVFANFPVTDLARATAFYTALGFKQNHEYSDERASGMVWDEHFWVMLLTRDYYQEFLLDKKVADPKTVSSALVAFSLDTPDEVRAFAKAAADNGGNFYRVDTEIPDEVMVGFEVVDLDGNILEPTWMAQ